MNSLKNVFFISVMVQLYFTQVNGIRCFQCNSVNNSGCVNLENYGKNLFYPIQCDDIGVTKAFCRKTVIQVMEKNKQHDPRVIRGCGYIHHKHPCYRADNEGHYEQVCQCFKDGCNSATSTRISFYLLFLSLFIIGIIKNSQ